MLKWFRVHASPVAASLLMSVGALGGSLASQHPDDCHDAACATILVSHDAAAHHVRPAQTDADAYPLHCLVCHWARSFRPRTEARFIPAPAVEASVRIHDEIFTAVPVARVAQPPLRSPPTSPILS
jgi:hypothetical protein